jgi:2-amino-4-hydroxy-6-hydroxymethyldihydropteridine diphosphokinase
MSIVYLALGSNKGERLQFMQGAVDKLKEDGRIEVIKSAPVYETAPFGVKEQGNFLNTVIKIETSYSAKELLGVIKKIESEAGRSKTMKWGPREIDIDIIFYDDIVLDEEGLTIPHKGILERRFVLEPLNDIASEMVHPKERKKIKELQLISDESETINKYSPLVI